MGELLLELLSEEIPARMQRRAIEDLTGLVRDKLAAAEIPASEVRFYVTPRRLTVIAEGIPARQPDRSEERRGPRVGAPQQAIDGFLRAAGLDTIDECEVRATDRGEFYFAVIQRPGQATGEVLPELLHAAIAELPWPKSMRYPASQLRWVRPLTSVICLLDGEVLPLALGDVPVGRMTRGHRFLSRGEIAVDNAGDYLKKLDAAHVVLNHDRRRELIAKQLAEQANAAGVRLKDDPGLLDEVAGLVEFPVVLMGTIDDEFVRPLPEGLPPEVLATAMRTHQKYFSCLKPDGSPAPRFLFVANNLTPDQGKTIVAGNERVLRARLADARFFWEQDRKIRLEDRVEALKDRVYYDKLGTMYDKTERMEQTSFSLASFLQLHLRLAQADGAPSDILPDPMSAAKLAQRAARLCKADLSTGMVGEFPELQGVMGCYYAQDDEDPRVADAIAEHYRPLGPSDACPTAPLSVILALADKFDALVGFFAINEKPTGSRDPFALRRAALGVIRLILENQLRMPLKTTIDYVSNSFKATNYGLRDIKPDLLAFVEDRLKVHLREQGVRHDLITAVFARGEDDLLRLLGRVRALQEFLNTEDGANLLIAYRRAANIVAIEERRDGHPYDPVRDFRPLREAAETALDAQLLGLDGNLAPLLEAGIFEGAMTKLAALRRWVDEFFDRVTVNTDEKVMVDGVAKSLREARLRLLSRIRAVMNQVADFSQIEG